MAWIDELSIGKNQEAAVLTQFRDRVPTPHSPVRELSGDTLVQPLNDSLS
jgi:hypothetical protein